MPYPLAIIVMVAMLAAAGYYYIRFVTHLFMRALTEVSRAGAVVAFKPGGEPVTLKRDAKTAGEIVDAILRRLL